MKRLLIILISLTIWQVTQARAYRTEDIPNVQVENRYRFTSNPDGILDEWSVAKIDSICYDLHHRGIAQTAVVAVKEINTDDVFEFAYELFSKWGVGNKSNSGIGILLVEQAREIRFVTGYGIEGVLPDAICKRIQTQYMLPYFSNGDYSRGMVAGLEAIRSVLNGSELDAGLNDDYYEEDDEFIAVLMTLFVIMVFGSMVLVLIIDRASRKCPNCKQLALQKDSVRVLSHNFGATTYEDTFVCTKCGTIVKRKRQDYDSTNNNRRGGGPIIMGGFGGGSSFGGSSFGGGWGGGSFGGGGAGSRW